MYSKTSVLGYVGGTPELRFTPSGVPVTRFSVAVNRTYKSGEITKKETTWVRVSAWRGLAEPCNTYLHKGRPVFVEGRLVPDLSTGGPRVWTGKDGMARASFELTATDVRFIGPNDQGDEDAPDVEEEEAPF